MAKGNPPESDLPPRPKRRRRPPVLELQATEVGAAASKPRAADSATNEAKATGSSRARDWLSAAEWGTLASIPLLSGIAGAIAGAVLVFVVLSLRGGEEAPASGLAGEVAALSAKIEALAARPVVAPESPALGARIDRLTAAIGDAEQRLAAVEKRPLPQAPDLSAVNQRTAAIETALKDLRGALEELRRVAEQAPPPASPASVETLASRIGGLEERITALAAPRAAPAITALAAEIAALDALAEAVRSGRSFTKELEAARARLGERAAQLAPLEPLAGNGVPTVTALADRFSSLAPQLIRGPDLEGGIVARLLTNASRLVEVRPVGEPEGKGVGAVVARIEAKLARGDLAGALGEAELLPEPAKAAAAQWTAAARQRSEAELTVKKLVDAALSPNTGRAQP